MAAATAGRDAKEQPGTVVSYPLAASTTIYKGTLVAVNAAGYLLSISDAANLIFVGVAEDTINNSSGAAGDKSARVRKDGTFEFVYAGGNATQANVGDVVNAQDNQTVDEDAALTTNDYPVGVVAEFVSASLLRVRIDGYTK
ncbi:MAG: hypothetical protein FJX77_02195 [Armatimonadetes bacterium]|nr:hypothetical protein [Armatimonadota bacterium]